jgi:hypothetical protein
MDRSFAALMLGGVLVFQMLAANPKSAQSANPQPVLASEDASVKLPALPNSPQGQSTIMGGTIRNLDPVRDQFRLKAFGQKPMTILYDERTQVYLDGKNISMNDLRPTDNASVQTVLDGTTVFALSIHLLSRSPEGEYQGQVLDFNSDTRELTLSATSSRDRVKLLVSRNTPILRVGQGDFASVPSGSSDLVKGTVVLLTFESDDEGRDIATRISILAIPGSVFVFSGNLSSLDIHLGLLTLVDPSDGTRHQISFDSSELPTSHTLREGENVRVTTTFDGFRYIASAIVVD